MKKSLLLFNLILLILNLKAQQYTASNQIGAVFDTYRIFLIQKEPADFFQDAFSGDYFKISSVQVHYENGYGAVVWTTPSIKSYLYSDEVFDKLGYTKIKSDYANIVTYINCSDNILIEVGTCQNQICIAMQWFSQSAKKQTRYFMSCK